MTSGTVNQREVVTSVFENHPDIKVEHRQWSPEQYSWSGQSALYLFARPKKPTYDPERLNDLLGVLGQDLGSPSPDYFMIIPKGFEQPKARLALGRLCLDSDQTLLLLFPDRWHLQDAMEGRNLYDIPIDELGQQNAKTQDVVLSTDAAVIGRPHFL